MFTQQLEWKVLLIGGPSGVGKTDVARLIGLQRGISWFQVDDLRLALQYSRAMFPEGTQALYFFEETPNVWQLSSEQLRDGLIAVGEVMSLCVEIVAANHVDTASPIVIEGDGILPSLCERPQIQDYISKRQVRVVFLIEPEEDIMLANIVARNRSMTGRTEIENRTEAHAKWLYGQWLSREAHRYNLPVLEPRPWSTLVERIMTLTG